MEMQLKIQWWNANNRSEPTEVHREYLKGRAFEHISRLLAEGFTAGQLLEQIQASDTESDEVSYEGYWDLKESMALNNAEDPVSESIKHNAQSVSEGWELLPEDLRTHLNDWRTACCIARDNATEEDDRSYWVHQVNVLERIKRQLKSRPEV